MKTWHAIRLHGDFDPLLARPGVASAVPEDAAPLCVHIFARSQAIPFRTLREWRIQPEILHFTCSMLALHVHRGSVMLLSGAWLGAGIQHDRRLTESAFWG